MQLSAHLHLVKDIAATLVAFYVLFRLDLFRRQLKTAADLQRARETVRDRGLTVFALHCPTSIDCDLKRSLDRLASIGEFAADRHGTVWAKARCVDPRTGERDLFVYIGVGQATARPTSAHIPRVKASQLAAASAATPSQDADDILGL